MTFSVFWFVVASGQVVDSKRLLFSQEVLVLTQTERAQGMAIPEGQNQPLIR